MGKYSLRKIMDKQTQVVVFSSTAIALYGYDQGMMSLINTNYNYLYTMGIAGNSALVGLVVSVYYLGCAVGAVVASRFADAKGRKPGIFACLVTASLGNLLMFVAGMGGGTSQQGALATMLCGRVVMGLGVGGIDAVVPVYSSELQEDDARGTALAQEFQANIFGLNMAYILNVGVTHGLGKWNQWAWRVPIIVMQIYPLLLLAVANLLPETPRWCVLHGDNERAKRSIARVFGKDQVDDRITELTEAHKREQEEGTVGYWDMLSPTGSQFHPTVVTVMGQVNQALTGYGAVSVFGAQIFQLLGFGVNTAEYITLGNYVFYLAMMTVAWVLIDRIGRRKLMVAGALWLAISFALLTLLGGLAFNRLRLSIPLLATGIPGIIFLYLATAVFGICWLVPPWLIPTEIYPSTARAQGAAVSVIVWGLANFAVTLLTPIGFDHLEYYLFLVFAATNAFAGLWTYLYCPESGNRTFEENQEFFKAAAAETGSWVVSRVVDGEFKVLPQKEVEEEEEIVENGEDSASQGRERRERVKKQKKLDAHEETAPLLGRTTTR
ncbi:uncharacterized protein Z520_09293 [Fonsecaea multimorphosa CBS 102226]|uniref:Major facilitator superfamily (MFS) profile domain-containing protein n=1 Tax=Fonsecaea multimorphosa CBS 102226 TaxID=1442371 RepID=A0A0D2KE59_9EURO|nr:uncharacterized protein Z520_09293 [Fonsecaea multimorphosa CBS 102226]KIX94983.1 hypothetical protein Z520_09293 [Fonsecaea multimorphosa CBS 102226]OAL20633.1 hypothetical protein AYO22_08642 [Fonsecaea multimorphosa]